MSIIGGLDVPRAQITFDWIDRDSGETHRGRIAPATRAALCGWLGELPGGQGAFAVEGCTGWGVWGGGGGCAVEGGSGGCLVVEELQAAGSLAHWAERAETSSRRGPKRRAKTD